MSTQELPGVPFALAQDQQNFRLLELPQNLLDLLSSPNPPLLHIKSKPAPPTNNPLVQQKQNYAVLCTPSETFQLRQVHTSNSVLLTQPVISPASPHEIPVPAISAVAKCGALLEVQPITDSAVPVLRDAITRIWNCERWDGDTVAGFSGESVKRNKHQLFADIPFSDEQCEQAWREICAFEHENQPAQPTLPALWMYWKTIFSTAIAEGVNLTAQFKAGDLAKTLKEEEGLWPALVNVIIQRLLPDDQIPDGDWAVIDQSKCIPWVGRNLLAAMDSHYKTPRPTAEFLDLWRDALPESWREDAVLEHIQSDYILPSDTTIAPKTRAMPTLRAATTVDAGSTSAKGPRKWHEKFKATRRTKGKSSDPNNN
ncbi:sister chromatid cohesion protein Dcc1 [Phyllosticta paracitricarpa]|uniref:Sister chromatid cohesion protein Dcc1 n=1 Tax=Phyllosticta paracitricarpa TaxID=2016321 RepID=A0ABR1MZA3_9PEZI